MQLNNKTIWEHRHFFFSINNQSTYLEWVCEIVKCHIPIQQGLFKVIRILRSCPRFYATWLIRNSSILISCEKLLSCSNLIDPDFDSLEMKGSKRECNWNFRTKNSATNAIFSVCVFYLIKLLVKSEPENKVKSGRKLISGSTELRGLL